MPSLHLCSRRHLFPTLLATLLLGGAALHVHAEPAARPFDAVPPPRLSVLMGLGQAWQAQHALHPYAGTLLDADLGAGTDFLPPADRFAWFTQPSPPAALAAIDPAAVPLTAGKQASAARFTSPLPADYAASGFTPNPPVKSAHSPAAPAFDQPAAPAHSAPVTLAWAASSGAGAPPIAALAGPQSADSNASIPARVYSSGGQGPGIFTGRTATQGAAASVPAPPDLANQGFTPNLVSFGKYTRIVDTMTYPPGQSTFFSQFVSRSLSGTNVIFAGGFNSGSSAGIYTGGTNTGGLTRIVDTSMNAPGQSTLFSSTNSPVISGVNVAFAGSFGSNTGTGIYTATANVAGATRIVDTSLNAPGQTTRFSSVGSPALSGNRLAFLGSYNSYNGAAIYTATVGTAGATVLVDNSMNAPGQSTLFTGFDNPLAISGTNVAFRAYYNAGKGQGIYTGVAGTAGATRIADFDTTVPGQSVKFSQFYPPVLSGNNLVTLGISTACRGLYAGTVGTAGLTLVADTTMNAPGRTTPFTDFPNNPSLQGSLLAFSATYQGGSGLYTATLGTAGLTLVADTSTTLVPGRTSRFTGLGSVVTSGDNLVFYGTYSGGAGIFLSSGGNLFDLVKTGDSLFGSTISALTFSKADLDGNNVSFGYTLASGLSGIGVVTVPEPATYLGAALLLGAAGWHLRRRVRAEGSFPARG